jgi:hypothetical protein
MTASILPITEADFQRRVLAAARWNKWCAVHIRATESQKGRWTVPYEGDKGLPDLILAKDGKVILAELKSASGKPTKDQIRWLDNAGEHGRLWTPDQWTEILDELMS